MSQNKTMVPGMNPGMGGANAAPNSNNFGGVNGFDPYSRNLGGARRQPAQGTVVPDMSQPVSGEVHNVNTSKPVVGFLYSVSRSMVGEYWPLHIGRNTIGQSSSCDIVLGESTVSSEHAELVVRQKNDGSIISSLSDPRSTNGTMINGESLDFSARECFNGDIITIGINYQLLLILLDASKLGLKPVEGFMAVETEPAADPFAAHPFGPSTRTPDFGQPTPPFGNMPGWGSPLQSGGMASSSGTVGMDGIANNNRSGGTQV